VYFVKYCILIVELLIMMKECDNMLVDSTIDMKEFDVMPVESMIDRTIKNG